MFKKEDFRPGDYIILRNGERMIYTKDIFVDIVEHARDIKNPITNLSYFDDKLKYRGPNNDFDIIAIKRPRINIIPRFFEDSIIEEKIETIWVRKKEKEEPAKEMTIEEISEALGYDVKVIKKRG